MEMDSLLPVEEQYYSKIFGMYRNNDDVVEQAKVVELLSKSHLEKPVLAEIWALSVQGRLVLSKQDFFDTIRYVAIAQAHEELSFTNLCKEGPRIPRFAGIPTPSLPSPSTLQRQTHATQAKLSQAKEISVWQMARENIDFYEQTRRVVDHRGTGFVDSSTANALFAKSDLPQEVLDRVWFLSDVNKNGFLNRAEFHVAMHLLMTHKKHSVPLPSHLPLPLQTHISNFNALQKQQQSQEGAQPQNTPVSVPMQSPSPAIWNTTPSQTARQDPNPVSEPPTAAAPEDPYVIDAHTHQHYLHTFNFLDTDDDGEISAAEAVPVFTNSNLPQNDLKDIWSLCDTRARGRLSRAEFVVAQHLMAVRRAFPAVQIPVVLPQNLKEMIEEEVVEVTSPVQPPSAPPLPSHHLVAPHNSLTLNNPASPSINFEDTAVTLFDTLSAPSAVPLRANSPFAANFASTNSDPGANSAFGGNSLPEQAPLPASAPASAREGSTHRAGSVSSTASSSSSLALPQRLDDAIMSSFVASVAVIGDALSKNQQQGPAQSQSLQAVPAQPAAAAAAVDETVSFGMDSSSFGLPQKPATVPVSRAAMLPDDLFGSSDGFSAHQDVAANDEKNVSEAVSDLMTATGLPNAFSANFDNQPSKVSDATPATSQALATQQQLPAFVPQQPVVDPEELKSIKQQIADQQTTIIAQGTLIATLQSQMITLTEKLEAALATQQRQQTKIDELTKQRALSDLFDNQAAVAQHSAPTAQQTTNAAAAVVPAQNVATTTAKVPSKAVNDFLQSGFGDDESLDGDFYAPARTTTTTATTSTTTTTTTTKSSISSFDIDDGGWGAVPSSAPKVAEVQPLAPTAAAPAAAQKPAASAFEANFDSGFGDAFGAGGFGSKASTGSFGSAGGFDATGFGGVTHTPEAQTSIPAPKAAEPTTHSATAPAPSRVTPNEPTPTITTQPPQQVTRTTSSSSDEDDTTHVSAFGFGQSVPVQDLRPAQASVRRGSSAVASAQQRSGDGFEEDTGLRQQSTGSADFDSFGGAMGANPFDVGFGFGADISGITSLGAVVGNVTQESSSRDTTKGAAQSAPQPTPATATTTAPVAPTAPTTDKAADAPSGFAASFDSSFDSGFEAGFGSGGFDSAPKPSAEASAQKQPATTAPEIHNGFGGGGFGGESNAGFSSHGFGGDSGFGGAGFGEGFGESSFGKGFGADAAQGFGDNAFGASFDDAGFGSQSQPNPSKDDSNKSAAPTTEQPAKTEASKGTEGAAQPQPSGGFGGDAFGEDAFGAGFGGAGFGDQAGFGAASAFGDAFGANSQEGNTATSADGFGAGGFESGFASAFGDSFGNTNN